MSSYLFFNKKKGNKSFNQAGFGLVETLVGVLLFVLISTASYGAFTKILRGVQILKIKNAAANLANEQIEIVRNLPYTDVGIVNGLPVGKIPRDQLIVRGDITFDVNTSVQDIDDPFDGTFGGTPSDSSPTDYKLIEIIISCENCAFTNSMSFYTRVAPQALETGSENGALFVQVFDANGDPIQGASVHIENNQGSPVIVIDDTTDIDGFLKVFDTPPGIEAYEISVTKSGYSSEKTYLIGEPENPNPDRPHINVVAGEITTASFAIDYLGDLVIKTREIDCSIVEDVDFHIRSSKTIGSQVFKYEDDLQTGASGKIGIEDVEWDNYFIDITDTSYDLYGSNVILPINVNPGSSQNIDLIVGNVDPNALLVQIKDAGTGLPLSGTEVTLTKIGYEEVEVTGNGFINQSDWSGGSGQSQYVDETRFYTTDNNIEYLETLGQLTLIDFAGSYGPSGQIESSYFDTGTTTNFQNFSWALADQVDNTTAKFQLATNLEITATTTWGFFGPDGGSSTYYETPNDTIGTIHDGDRYLRYKLFLDTTVSTSTPLISDVNFTYSTECVPPGQVIFTGLDTGTYVIEVKKSGYQDFLFDNLIVDQEWDEFEVTMTP